jgi:hypothetical protein
MALKHFKEASDILYRGMCKTIRDDDVLNKAIKTMQYIHMQNLKEVKDGAEYSEWKSTMKVLIDTVGFPLCI